MLFNSLTFLFFFPTVLIIYYWLPFRLRNLLLLVASYYFYMSWNPTFILLIVASTFVDYWCSSQMAKFTEKSQRKPYLYFSLIFNLGLLFTFKYFNFFSTSLAYLFSSLDISLAFPMADLLLPMGISFYTFQTMGYSIDVYQGKLQPEKNPITFALYVSFFSQLVAGPIERANRLLPQFYNRTTPTEKNFLLGFQQILWGFFKKVVIADRLALLVNSVYNVPQNYDGTFYIIATFFFAFQIYCDFSGYCDIAIGTAKMLGFDLMKNFDTPYFSKSLGEFWKRWHISLSTWFRDYLYIPLGGNRVVKWRWYYNLFITFLISGLWHGANWTFVIWGAMHGVYLIIENATTSGRQKIRGAFKMSGNYQLYRIVSCIFIFCFVNFCWIFFRANSISDAYLILSGITDFNLTFINDVLYQVKQAIISPPSSLKALNLDYGRVYLSISVADFILSFILIFFLVLVEMNQNRIKKSILKLSLLPQIGFYYLAIMAIVFFGVFSSQQFIYFQF